jgi:curved DNA-binding protein CbpA
MKRAQREIRKRSMANQVEATNYYEILEVAPEAPPHEIHRAYQRAKSTYSADNPALYSMFSPDEARELLRLIEEAYSVLGNPGLRRTYDEGRASSPTGHISMPGHNAAATAPSPMTQNMNQATPPQNIPRNMPPSPVSADPVQVVVAHQSLPDFATPESAGAGSMRAHSMKPSLPPGMGRTQLSTFKIDENFENELAGAIDFDGNLLQRTRLYKNISIDRLSEATRISRPYLMAVETNDYKNLPAAVFVRGFVVQVARVLGLNENKVAASYIKMFKAGGGK